jgi:hypothetical protein
MSSRAFCNRCAAEVENAGGFCLLGHRLSALAPPPPPPPAPVMSDLAEAVAEVFEEAEAKVTALTPAATEAEPPSRYASSVERTWAELETAPAPSPDDPINTFAPPPRMDWGPRRSPLRLKLRRERAEASV